MQLPVLGLLPLTGKAKEVPEEYGNGSEEKEEAVNKTCESKNEGEMADLRHKDDDSYSIAFDLV